MRGSWLAAVAVALLAGPVVVQAQPSSPSMYCIPGTPFACFGMEFTMSGATGTLWLQNLQGSATSDATPWSLSSFTVLRRNPTGEGGLPTEQLAWSPADNGSFVGPALTPGATFDDGFQEDSNIEDETTVFQTRLYFHGGSGIFGCDMPPGEWVAGEYLGQTCPVRGFDGWWRMVFGARIVDPATGATTRELVRDDVTFRIGGCVVLGATSGIAAGERGPDCVAAPYPNLTAVPEPGTLALLGGGLGVLGLVGWRRRVRAG